MLLLSSQIIRERGKDKECYYFSSCQLNLYPSLIANLSAVGESFIFVVHQICASTKKQQTNSWAGWESRIQIKYKSMCRLGWFSNTIQIRSSRIRRGRKTFIGYKIETTKNSKGWLKQSETHKLAFNLCCYSFPRKSTKIITIHLPPPPAPLLIPGRRVLLLSPWSSS